jgi:hypothetical protein
MTRSFEDREEFGTVRREMQAKLRSGAYVSFGTPLLRLAVLPSFDASYSFELRELRRGRTMQEARIVHTRWDIETDRRALLDPVERLRYPRPYVATVIQRSAELSATELEQVRSRLQSVSVPLAIEERYVAVDGTRYALEHFGHCRSLRLAWHEVAERASPLSTLMDELLAFCARKLHDG